MRPVGEVPPDVLRLDFCVPRPGWTAFAVPFSMPKPQEQHDLNWLMDAVTEYFEPPDTLGQATVPKEEQPYGAQQQLAIHLENLLILLARRYKRARKPGVRLRRSAARPPGGRCPHLLCQKPGAELRVDEVCRPSAAPGRNCRRPSAPGCGIRLWRNSPPCGWTTPPSCWPGAIPPARWPSAWATAAGPTSAKKFKEATGNTPSAYRRLQQGLPARRLNRQQKTKTNRKPLLQKHRQKSKIG